MNKNRVDLIEGLDGLENSKLPEFPFLPPKTENSKPYTLVLDLDETLIHYPEEAVDEHSHGCYNLRPGLHKFLASLSEYYEIVIFTAGTQEYADYILDQIDFLNKISYRLYRQHTIPTNNVYTKDLDKLGRDITKTIIVDNLCENFEKHFRNGIEIKSWYDDLEDSLLPKLENILIQIATDGNEDIRESVSQFRLHLSKIKPDNTFNILT